MSLDEVSFFDTKKGWGFIKNPVQDAPDIFVHYRDILGEGFKNLDEGQAVEFELVERADGPAAVEVTPIA